MVKVPSPGILRFTNEGAGRPIESARLRVIGPQASDLENPTLTESVKLSLKL